jgi:hypothetical protein
MRYYQQVTELNRIVDNVSANWIHSAGNRSATAVTKLAKGQELIRTVIRIARNNRSAEANRPTNVFTVFTAGQRPHSEIS